MSRDRGINFKAIKAVPSETPKEKYDRKLSKVIAQAQEAGVYTLADENKLLNGTISKLEKQLKDDKVEMAKAKDELKVEKDKLKAEKDKFKTEKEELENEKKKLKEEISELNLSIDDRKKVIEKYKEIVGSEIDIKKLFEDDLSLIIDSISDYTLLLAVKKCIEEGGSVRVKIEEKEKELEEEKRKIEEEKQRIEAEKRAKGEEEIQKHLRENRNKWPLYDKDGNPIEVSDEKVKFLDMASNIEKYCIKKGIDTIYFVDVILYSIDHNGPDGLYSHEHSCYNNLFNHAGFCQKEDGTMYYVKNCDTSVRHAKMEYYEDAQRFWKNMFPNMNVQFLSGESHTKKELYEYKRCITCKFPKIKGALLMGENYGNESLFEQFKGQNGECIEYDGSGKFIEGRGIENFSD